MNTESRTEESVFLSAQEGYDQWASLYDQDDIPLTLLEETVVERELGDVSDLKIVDLGCGTGRQSLRLARRGAMVTALDQSEGMLAKARHKYAGESVRFLKHNLDEFFPFADGEFDRVVSFLVLEHITDLPGFFAECRRVCDPRGFLYFSAMHPAMLLKGVQARFTDHKGTKIYPKGFPYQISDYVNAAFKVGLRLEHLNEYACASEHAEVSARATKYMGWPLLLTMKFNID